MATNKSSNVPTEIDTLREKNNILLEFAKYAEQWARAHDYAFRLKAIDTLKKLGEWAS